MLPETTPTNIPNLDTENYGALYIELVTDDLVHLETTSFVFTIPRQPVIVDLVSLKTTLIDITYLDKKNYGALYIVPVTDNLVHPETISDGLTYATHRG